MSNHSVIEHRANYHYIKVEEDLIAICIGEKANPHCKALILAILEGWTNTKRDKGEDLAIYMTYPQWIRATYWLYGRNVIIEALEELLSDGLIERRAHHTHDGKDTFVYILKVKAIQDAIKALPEKSPDDYLPGFNLNAFKNKRVPNQTRPKSNGKTKERVYNQTGDAFNKERNIESITNLQSNITSEESNSDDTTKHTIVSSDTARALPGKTEELLEKLREWRIEDEQASFEIYGDIVPYTFVEALAYLAPHGGVPPGYGAIEVVKLAQKLYAEAHSQDEEVFTDDEPQGDDHAAASGHSHRLDDAAACGDNPSHAAVDSGQVAAPEDRPVLEARQEIDKGEHHASRVPIVPAANPAASGERHVSRPGSDHSGDITHPDNGLPAVHPMGIGTASGVGSREADIQRPVGKDRTAQTLAETLTTPMPAQSLSSPQAEQAVLGMTFVEARDYLRSLGYFLEPVPAMNGNWEIREPGERGFSVICGDEVRGIAEYQRKKREQAAPGQSPKGKGKGKKQAEPKPETPKGPPVAPPADMAWGTRKCLMWFDFWRGGILIGKWKLMQASTCAKGLAEQFDEQTVIQARTDMEADPYYIDKGGCDVCDVANNIHKYLKRRQGKQQPAIQPALKVVKRYSSYDDPNFRSDQDFYPVEGGSYATASR